MWDFGTETPVDGYHIDYSDYVKTPFKEFALDTRRGLQFT
jgi:hypothetical protein